MNRENEMFWRLKPISGMTLSELCAIRDEIINDGNQMQKRNANAKAILPYYIPSPRLSDHLTRCLFALGEEISRKQALELTSMEKVD